MADDRMQLPRPGWSPLTEGYWKAARDDRLVVQRCKNCGYHRAPPSWSCFNCLSTEWDWDDVPGTGTVFSYTWADTRAPADMPLFNIVVVELDGTEGEAVRLITQIPDIDKGDLECDAPVEVFFEPFDDEVAVPLFKLRR